ncbi:sulfite exporter TauE/SafE family protein [bacterium]|nr:sulfite exporter TauE/SafE family protein [bacterium]MCB2179174.1 sulfite exporter TauE/SafE family protein [bacterium]
MGFESILTSLSIGLLATTSPCVLPLYPGYLAYISGSQQGLAQQGPEKKTARYLLGFFVLAGVLVTMLALGGIIALLSVSVGRALSVVIPLADLLIIILGGLLLANINPFKQLPQIQVPVLRHPFANAFVYGMLYGPIALPCAGPLVVSIFALSLTTSQMLEQLSIFLWFGIGFGLPLLVLSFLSGAAASWITRAFARRARLINVISGLLLVGIGIFDVIANWDLITAYF